MSATDVGGDEFLTAIFAGAEGSVCIARPTKDRGYFQRSWCFGDAATLVPGPWYWCCSTSKATSKVDRDGVTTINRRKSDLARTCALVLDDIGTKVEEARVEQMLPPPSASLETSPGNFQWVYILDGGADPADAEVALARLAMAGLTDASAKDTSHVFRLPGSINDKVAVLERNGGQPWSARVTLWEPERRYTLDEIVERVPLSAAPKAKRKADANGHARHDKPNGDDGLVLDALSSIPGEDDYSEWARLGMALHAEVRGSPEGYRAFVAWSAKSSKFDARECERKWREWDRRPADRLTGGTIIYLARQNGWQDPRQAKSNGAAIENAADVENATDPTAEWPDIDPALTESARRDIPVFPVFLFPPAWRKWTVATAEGAGAPVDYVAMGLLGNVAGVTGCGVFVVVTASWREPVVVWTAAVGAPGMSKTPALAATRRLIDAVESAARDKDAERQREHETKAEAAKLAEEKWREEVAEAAEADKPPPTKPAAADRIEPFIPTQMVIEDATTESIVDVVRGNPRGVVLWRDEITAWLKNFSRYNAGSDRGFWLERWPASDAIVNRKARSTVRIQRLGVSIVGGIQPDRLGEICGDDDDGMASRFLFAWPERPPYKPLQERLAGSDDSAIERLQRIYALAGDAEQPLVLKLDAGAVEVLNEFCAEHHAEASEYEGLEAGWYGKGQGYVTRLAGVLTLLAWSETGSAGLPSTITAEAVHAAAGLWSGYYWPVARSIFARTGKTLANRQVRRIIAWIRRTEASTISMEDVRVSALGRTVDATDAAGLIARLVRYHVLRPAHPAARGPGKPPIRWDVNPALHTPQPEDAHA